jgi:hypothetical protein
MEKNSYSSATTQAILHFHMHLPALFERLHYFVVYIVKYLYKNSPADCLPAGGFSC